jgi:hypothetical protein
MRLPRLASLRVLLVLCVAAGLWLAAACGASEHSPARHPVVLASHALGVSVSELRGEAWALVVEQPSTAPHPHCVLLGNGRIMYPGTKEPCAVHEGVPVYISGETTFWTNLDPPQKTSDPREQARLATEQDRAHVKKSTITIDDHGPTNFLTPRFEELSRQFRVLKPKAKGVPAQEITFVAHGWGVVIKGLPSGRHHIHTDVSHDSGETEDARFDYVVDVLPRR